MQQFPKFMQLVSPEALALVHVQGMAKDMLVRFTGPCSGSVLMLASAFVLSAGISALGII